MAEFHGNAVVKQDAGYAVLPQNVLAPTFTKATMQAATPDVASLPRGVSDALSILLQAGAAQTMDPAAHAAQTHKAWVLFQ